MLKADNADKSDELHDVSVGLQLKKHKVAGIEKLVQVTRREIKILFKDKANLEKVGIIFDVPTNYDEKALLDCLEAPLPIINIYRCQKRKIVNGNKTNDWIPANTIKVTFRGQQVPDEVNLGYSSRKVKPDVPRVLQCFKCMRFGHASKFCKQEKQTCKRCGYQHDVIQGTKCEKELRCFHCHSNEHDAGDKSCPEFIRNSLVKETMVFRNLTFSEANKEYPRTESSFRLAEKARSFLA